MANGSFGGGDGTSGNPYLVEDAADLDAVRNKLYNTYYLQVADIDLSGGFTPIGPEFEGSYDGGNYTIANWTYSSANYNVGLFLKTSTGSSAAKIKNIVIDNFNVTSTRTSYGTASLLVAYAGSVTDISGCVIKNSTLSKNASDGSVGAIGGEAVYGNFNDCVVKNTSIYGPSGSSAYIGGICGWLANYSDIRNCYVEGVYIEGEHCGGVVGSVRGENDIYNCYSKVDINGAYSGGMIGEFYYDSLDNYNVRYNVSIPSLIGTLGVGGICGLFTDLRNDGTAPNVTDTFWDVTFSGVTTSAVGTGKTTTELQTKSTFANFDFLNGTWHFPETGYIQLGVGVYPIAISNLTEFEKIRNNLGSTYELKSDIDFSSLTSWTPLGDSSVEFRGKLFGNGYTLKNLTASFSSTYGGLFGKIKGDGSLDFIPNFKDIKIDNFNISGSSSYLGIFASLFYDSDIEKLRFTNCKMSSTSGKTTASPIAYISNCDFRKCSSTNVEVQANFSYVGGFVGYASGNNKIKESYTESCTLSNATYTGGIVGRSYGLLLSNCYSRYSTITASSYAAGLIGYVSRSNDTVEYCYSATSFDPNATETKDSLLGYVTVSPTLTGLFYDNELGTSIFGTGKTTAEMQTQSTFTNWDFTNVWFMDGYPELIWSVPPPVVVNMISLALNSLSFRRML